MTDDSCPSGWMAQEESVKEKIDESGNKWRKVYFGSGTHFANWLSQFIEVYGEENIEVEELDSCELACFENGTDKPIRIWARTAE